MITAASILALVLLAVLALFQIALIAGTPLGRFAWGGQHKVLPSKLRIGSASSIIIYAFMAALVTSKSGFFVIFQDQSFVQIALWVCSIYLSLGVLLNGISRSKPERYTMTPTALILAICFWIITLA